MNSKERIRKTADFLWNELQKSIFFQDNNQRSLEYRYEHSLRVANIGRLIALEEGINEEKTVISCLLHDIGYSMEFKDKSEYINHGRIGAKLARPFLSELGYSEQEVEEMCFGIAIHVDDKADFEHESTKLALTIGDADNIDRFDAFRLYESLQNIDYMNLSLQEQCDWLNKNFERLNYLKNVNMATPTAKKMWEEKIDFQIAFFNKLKMQAENSRINKILAFFN